MRPTEPGATGRAARGVFDVKFCSQFPTWIWWLDIRTLHLQESSDYGISGSLDEPAEAGF
jgi:hypothetical protein